MMNDILGKTLFKIDSLDLEVDVAKIITAICGLVTGYCGVVSYKKEVKRNVEAIMSQQQGNKANEQQKGEKK